jgi:hypothetical protein
LNGVHENYALDGLKLGAVDPRVTIENTPLEFLSVKERPSLSVRASFLF